MNHPSLTAARKSLQAFGLMMVTLLTVTLFTSCEPDEEEYLYYDIVGSWQQVAPDYGPVYDFFDDGTGMCYDDYYGDSFFEWEIDYDYLTLYFTDGYDYTTEYYTLSFQGNTLYLYPDYNTSNPLVLKPI